MCSSRRVLACEMSRHIFTRVVSIIYHITLHYNFIIIILHSGDHIGFGVWVGGTFEQCVDIVDILHAIPIGGLWVFFI